MSIKLVQFVKTPTLLLTQKDVKQSYKVEGLPVILIDQSVNNEVSISYGTFSKIIKKDELPDKANLFDPIYIGIDDLGKIVNMQLYFLVKSSTLKIKFNLAMITITFSECVENHIGNQQIGKERETSGFSCSELKSIEKNLLEKDMKVEYHDLTPSYVGEDTPEEAGILIIRNGVNNLNEVIEEQLSLSKDTKYLDRRRKRVLNKSARHNLCFADFSQEPDYENGKGRVVSFDDLSELNKIRVNIGELLGDKAVELNAEGNYYYNIKDCGIGYHGDAERKIVVGVRLGASMPIYYQWFDGSKLAGDRIKLELNSGDIYVMSSKAVGNDWKRRLFPTLRHSVGYDDNSKYVNKK